MLDIIAARQAGTGTLSSLIRYPFLIRSTSTPAIRQAVPINIDEYVYLPKLLRIAPANIVALAAPN